MNDKTRETLRVIRHLAATLIEAAEFMTPEQWIRFCKVVFKRHHSIFAELRQDTTTPEARP